MLTKEQIQKNIETFEQQGASPVEIQIWIDSLKTTQTSIQTQVPVSSNIPEIKKSFGEKVISAGKAVGSFLTQSEQKFGKDIGQATYLMFGGQKEIDKISQQYLDNGNKLLELATKQTNPEKKKKLLQMATDDFKQSGMTTQEIIGEIKSNKQILGDAAGVLVDILAFGTYGKAIKGAESFKLMSKAPTAVSTFTKGATEGIGFVKGAIKGAKAGVKVGGIVGTAYGITGGMQEGKDTLGIIGGGIKGGIIGGITGGVFGGVTGGISGVIQKRQLRVAEQEKALKSIIPQPKELTPTEYEELLKKGRVTPKTATKTAQIIPTNEEITLANQYSELLQSKDPVKNINNVLKEIVNSDTKVGKYLKEQNRVYSKPKLKIALIDKIKDITDIYVPSEDRLNKMKLDLVDGFMKQLGDNDLSDLWSKRKLYDQIIDKTIKTFGGSPNLKKEITREIRNGVQEFITNQLGEEVYKNEMKNMTNLYKISDLITNKAARERTQSGIIALIKKHPTMAKILGYGGGGIGIFTIGKKLLTGNKSSDYSNLK